MRMKVVFVPEVPFPVNYYFAVRSTGKQENIRLGTALAPTYIFEAAWAFETVTPQGCYISYNILWTESQVISISELTALSVCKNNVNKKTTWTSPWVRMLDLWSQLSKTYFLPRVWTNSHHFLTISWFYFYDPWVDIFYGNSYCSQVPLVLYFT